MLRQLHCILLIILPILRLGAQSFEVEDFKRYTTNEGLSNNFISGIVQDSLGYVWISTARGLNRFDGNIFKQFLHNGESNSIPDNAIISLQLLHGDQLAIATEDGAQLISTKTLEKKNLEIPTEDALRYWSNACRYISADRAGNYAVSTKTGFYIFTPDGRLKKRFDRYTVKDIGQSWMLFGNRIYQLPDGNVMQENSSGFYLYDRHKNSIEDVRQQYSSMNELIPVIKRRKDLLFFVSRYDLLTVNAHNNSFDLIDIRTGKIKSFPACFTISDEIGWQTNPSRINDSTWALNSRNKGFYLLQIDSTRRIISCSPKKNFSDYRCTVIFSDYKQRVWIGTTAGIFKQIDKDTIVRSFTVEVKSLSDNFSITALHIQDNRLFAGTDKNRVIILDKQTRKTLHEVILLPEKNRLVLTSFLLVHPDTLWASTNAGIFWLHTKNFTSGELFPDYPIIKRTGTNLLFKDKKNSIWIATNRINTIYRFDMASRNFDSLTTTKYPLLNINIVTSFAEDKEGNIWIGGDAITRWNVRLQKIDTLIAHLRSQKNRKKGYTVMNNSRGDIWTSVNDDGFARISDFHPRIHVRNENLLQGYDDEVYPSVSEDKIFIGTMDGVGFLDIPVLRSAVFHTAADILQHKITSYRFFYDPLDRSQWFASKNMVSFIPLRFQTMYAKPPVLKISAVTVINDSVINYPSESITLRHNQDDLTISLSAINFTDPFNMRFSYRIKNKKDTSWIEMGAQQNILLTNFSAGRYRLETRVYAYDNRWPEQTKEIEIIIEPPFWKTTGFFIVIGLIFVGTFYYLYKKRVRYIKQKANVDKLLAQTEMKALHSQMNPHFIFNCLNSIREMILNNENQQASHYLSKFAQLIRMTLKHSSKPFISLQNTIDHLKRYLEMEQIRTPHFQYTIEVDDKLYPDEVMLPPMLIQPFIENAIWHGALPLKEPMQLSIRFLQKGQQLICVVEDNGVGIEVSLRSKEAQMNHQSVGISNIRQRIQVLNEKYNLHSTMKIEDKSCLTPKNGTGTIVTLHLPIKNTET